MKPCVMPAAERRREPSQAALVKIPCDLSEIVIAALVRDIEHGEMESLIRRSLYQRMSRKRANAYMVVALRRWRESLAR